MRFSLRTKLLSAFGVVLALLAIVGLIGWQSTTFLSTALHSQYTDNVQGAVYLSHVESALWELRYGVAQFIVSNDQTRAQIIADTEKWKLQIEQNLAAYKEGSHSREELEALTTFEELFAKYIQARPRWIELQQAGKIEEAAEWRAQTIFPYGTAGVEALDALITLQREVADNNQSAAVAAARTSIWLLGAVTFLALAFGLAIGLVLAQSIAGAANLVARVSGAIAQGDVEQEVRIKSGDELEQMAISFSQMVAYLREMTEAADRLAEGDLTVQVEPRSEKDALGHAFERMTEKLRELIGEVQASAAQVALASEQISESVAQTGSASQQITQVIQQVAAGTAQQTHGVALATSNVEQVTRAAEGIAQGAQEQAMAVQRTSALVAEMAAVVSQVDAVARAVAGASSKVMDSARQGSVAVGQSSQGMEQIQARTAQAMSRVKEMGTRTAEIGRIVEVIDDIADKTDMLALNAAVEAARAGEHGRGFAVVADQVRKLSEDAKSATRDIGQLITRVNEAVREVIAAMEASVTEVGSGTRQSAETTRSLKEILDSAEESTSLAAEITSAVEQVRQRSEGVLAAIELVSAVVEENTASAEELAASSHEVTSGMERVADVAEENSAAVEEVGASLEEMSAQVEEVVSSAQELAKLAVALRIAVAQFRLEEHEPIAHRGNGQSARGYLRQERKKEQVTGRAANVAGNMRRT